MSANLEIQTLITYHAVAKAIDKFFQVPCYQWLCSGEVIGASCEKNSRGKKAVSDAKEGGWSLSFLRMEIYGKEAAEAAL